MKKILVIGVHPDDETLGCGGTILKYKSAGHSVYWILITAMEKSQGFSDDKILKREKEIKEVSDNYKFDGVFRLNLPTTRLDSLPIGSIIALLSNIIEKIEPEIILLPFKSDVHSDHRIVFQAAYACTKNFRYPSIKKVLMMEILSETEFAPSTKEDYFIPNYFVDITEHLDEKIKIMQIYSGEMGEHPFPRSEKGINALATLRGIQACCQYAEAFMALKIIE